MNRPSRLLLDETDVRLIKELQADARLSMRALAARIGISTPTAASKVQRLVDSGAITGFTVNLDSAAFGLKDFVAEIKCQPKYQRSILQSMAELRHALLTQDSRVIGIFSGTEKEAVMLYNRMCNIRGVTSVALTPAVSYEFTPSRPAIESGAKLSSSCYYCRGDIGPAPVVERIGGKMRYFCCTSCRTLYLERYETLKGKVLPGHR